MELNDNFYENWKKKSGNKQFFSEEPSAKEKCSQNKQIFSSTGLQDQTDTESFSLHLSESYIEETPESTGSQTKQKQDNEIILISDSSIDESIFSSDKASKLLCNKKSNVQERRGIYILESSEDESTGIVAQPLSIKKNRKFDSILNSVDKQPSRKNAVIEESDSEIEESRVPEIIKETVTESVTLSNRKKKEILEWLSTNFDGSRCGSSCSQESAIASSRKSGISSGNSSLERLELNFETPNNRGKVSKPSTIEKSNRHRIDLDKQSTIDQYFTKIKGKLDIIKDKTPGSKHSDKTPVNKIKRNPRRILSELESLTSGTPNSRNSDKTPMNVKTKQNIIIPESESFESKSQENAGKILVQESESLGSKNNDDEEHIIISESESSDSSDFIKSYKKKLDLNYNSKSSIDKTPQKKIAVLSETVPLETSSDENTSTKSSVTNRKNEENRAKNQAPADTTINTTLNDCADILENLYGTTWRDKAKVLVSSTEPKKQNTKKIFNEIQTEKKITFRKPRFDNVSDDSVLGKENNILKKNSQTVPAKLKTKKKVKDSFINDSTTESSPDCSYYTAMSNPVIVQNKPNQTQSTVKANNKKKSLEICDSDCEPNNDVWKLRGKNQRKLSFDSSTNSSTSEFDPEDIVPPKMKSTKIIKKKSVNCQAATTKTIKEPEVKIKPRSFLASLSKDVPLEEADFKAMTYRVKYKTMKEELCKVLFKLFNEKVFSNQLPDDMPIEWSVRLRGTAGKCYNKQSLKGLGKTVRTSRLVLATKIIDSPDRLRDTLIHEMCHAATWTINNVSDGHGNFWKAWAHKAMKVFPELPPISRCHNYEIQTKYTYKCTTCGYSIGRHSKSLDLNRKRCGYCHGAFELLINKVQKDGTVQKKKTTQQQPSGFALYVKENYHLVKQNSTPAMKHGEVMKVLGQQFSAVKLTPKPQDRIRNNEDESP